jgi:hypothetical protein
VSIRPRTTVRAGGTNRRALVALLTLSVFITVAAWAGDLGTRPRVYYLFLAGAPQSCEDCYVPLLLTDRALDDTASSGGERRIVLITTYERDSIWKLERGVALATSDVSVAERIVRLRGRRYRFQEITPTEVLRLLEKPNGTIPIHRITPVPDTKSLEDLVAAFRGRS